RIDVHSARDDHETLAVSKVEISLRIDMPDITKRAPARMRGMTGLARLCGIVEILEIPATLEIDEAVGAGRHLFALLVADVQRSPIGTPDRPGALEPLLRRDEGRPIAFRSAIIFIDDRSEPFNHPALDLDRARRRGMDDLLKRGQIVTRTHILWQREHPHKHRRNHLHEGYAVAFHKAQDGLGVEALHDDKARPQTVRRHAIYKRCSVIERCWRKHHASFADPVAPRYSV